MYVCVNMIFKIDQSKDHACKSHSAEKDIFLLHFCLDSGREHPEPTLRDTADPLFPPACHLLLIYAA